MPCSRICEQDLDAIPFELLFAAGRDVFVGDDEFWLVGDVQRDGAGAVEFFAFRQDGEAVRRARHVADGLGAQLVFVGKAGFCRPAVRANEKVFHMVVCGGLGDERADNALGDRLVDAAEEDDLEAWEFCDEVSDEGAVRHECQAFFIASTSRYAYARPSNAYLFSPN